MRIRKIFRFEAAHMLPYHRGKCAGLHGHSYRLEVTVAGPLRDDGPDRGMVMDFGDISPIVKSNILDRLDHHHLNDIIENPTCERVISWIAAVLTPKLPQLEELVLWETDTACAELGRAEFSLLSIP
jgi:6-pyruvoyltetrahydropterin/6-carboxytetrahydropterin synthase